MGPVWFWYAGVAPKAVSLPNGDAIIVRPKSHVCTTEALIPGDGFTRSGPPKDAEAFYARHGFRPGVRAKATLKVVVVDHPEGQGAHFEEGAPIRRRKKTAAATGETE